MYSKHAASEDIGNAQGGSSSSDISLSGLRDLYP